MTRITISFALLCVLFSATEYASAQDSPVIITGERISFEPLKADPTAPKLPSAICRELQKYVDLVVRHSVTSPDPGTYEKETRAHLQKLKKLIEDIRDDNSREQAFKAFKHLKEQIGFYESIMSGSTFAGKDGKVQWVPRDNAAKKNVRDSFTKLKESLKPICQK
jgi:hypothetical protein